LDFLVQKAADFGLPHLVIKTLLSGKGGVYAALDDLPSSRTRISSKFFNPPGDV